VIFILLGKNYIPDFLLFLDWLMGKLPKSGNSINREIKNPIDDINLEDES